MKCCCRPKVTGIALLLCGVILIVLPLALHNYINEYIKKQIADKVKIAPGSQIFDQWKKPTLPIYLQIYTFSIVNPEEVKQGQPPFVNQKGPYSYRESREKFNITWGDNNVTYNQITNYTFDPDTSCKDCDPHKDIITSINIPYVAILQKLIAVVDDPEFNEVVTILLHFLKEGLFHTTTVHHAIWGYNETLFDDYDKFRDAVVKIPFIGKSLDNLLPKKFPKVFALQPNPNFDGDSTVNTGKSDIDLVGCYQQWKGNFGKLNIWNSDDANMINGTDGSVYRPDISKHDELYIFIIQLCRSLNVKFLNEVTKHGIDGYRFNVPKNLFESGDINPNNKGFCNPNCLPSGLLNVNACVPFNAPIVVSQPHFLNGNKSLQKMILGLNPDEEKHDTFLSVEPNTGILLEASKRIQFNIQVDPIKGVDDLENVKSAQVPIMWINEHVSIDEGDANKLKKEVLNNLEIIKWIEIGLYIVGGLMVLIAIILFICSCCKTKDETTLKLLAESVQNNSSNGRNYGSNSQSSHLNPSLINASD